MVLKSILVHNEHIFKVVFGSKIGPNSDTKSFFSENISSENEFHQIGPWKSEKRAMWVVLSDV
jgi:hypothetical protein